ncbi:hypothetical protein MYIN104542_29370 [Mycobacterium intermedium]
MTAGMMTLDTTPCQITPRTPTAAIVAPTMPPMSACDELEGMPSSQVSRFQTMPPTNPAKTNSSVTRLASIRPLAMVAATAVDKNAPIRFKTADRVTAAFGASAPLAMEVAMALPVSWKPLVKSKASAVITTMIKRNRSMLTGPDSCGRSIPLSNAQMGEMQEYFEWSLDVI